MIIDCMPSLGMLTINALTAADSVLIPMEPEYYAADGLMELLKVYSAIKTKFNPNLKIEGIVFTFDTPTFNNSKRNKKQSLVHMEIKLESLKSLFQGL